MTRLEEVVAEKGRTLTDVARGCGMQRTTLFSVKYGFRDINNMFYRSIRRVADELGVDVFDLIDFSDVDADLERRKEVFKPKKWGRPRKDGQAV